MRGALHALRAAGGSLASVLDATALCARREESRRAFKQRSAFFSHAPKADEAPLLGRRVCLHGLVSRPELNGKSGVAARYDEAKGRYEVQLDGEAATVLLRASSLQPLSAAAPPPPPPPCPPAGNESRSADHASGCASAGTGSPTHIPVPPSVSAQTYKEEGDKAFREGSVCGAARAWGAYAAAVGAASVADGPVPSTVSSLRWLATVYGNRSAASLALGCALQAVADAGRSVRCDGRWAKGHARLAAAEAARGDKEGAAHAYRQALALEPQNARWRESLRWLASSASHVDSLEHGPEHRGGGPETPETAAPAARFESAEAAKAQGNAAYQAGRYTEAAGLYTAALGLLEELSGRERAVLLSNRCAALVALGVVGGEALTDARGSVRADPTFVKGHLRLGTALLDRGDWEAAIDAIKDGLALDPRHAQLQAQLERAVGLSPS